MREKMTELTHEELTRLLDYDPETGVFRWKVNYSNRIKSGSIAGYKRHNGNAIGIGGKIYTTRRLAWFYVYGVTPPRNLFVKNEDRFDDRIGNIGILPDKPKQLTHEYLKKCIDYNPDTGEFKWKITDGKRKLGENAFYFDNRRSNNWLETHLIGKKYMTNRLIVFWMTGYMPSSNRVVFPIDNNVLNLKWNNIKVGSRTESQIKKKNYGQSGSKCVSFDKVNRKYKAKISVEGKQKHLGYYSTEAEAAEAYIKAARKHYGELANDGYQHAMYEMEYEPVERETVADELIESMEHAVDIAEGKIEPAVVHEVGF